VQDNIATNEVIITEERIRHIKERHPGDFERYAAYITDMIENPDYIICDERPCTAIVLKEFSGCDPSGHFRLALRLVTVSDESNFKNSVITFMKVRKKEYQRMVRNKVILYKRE
jgi:hypothetical protein